MARRLSGLLAASAISAAMLSATACTSTGVASSSASAPSTTAAKVRSLSDQQILPLFLQCLAEHKVMIWDKAQGDTDLVSVGKAQGWYVNGQVIASSALYSDAAGLEGFYPISPDFKPDQMIGTWLDNAANKGTWPKVCTPLP